MKICITAANCFIGLPLVKKASELGWEVVAVIREGNKKKEEIEKIKNVSVAELNLDDYGRLGKVVGSVDCLVMLTWNGTRGQTRNDAELQKGNYENCFAGIKSAIEHGCKRVVTSGSQAEYGLVNAVITEETLCRPNTEYGKYKLKLYECVDALCGINEVVHIEPRFFSLYGPGDYENTLVMSNIRKMKANESCDMTEGLQLWDYLYIDDAVDALAKLCIDGKTGVYNFGSGDCRPLREYVSEMKLLIGSKSKLNFGAVPYGIIESMNISPCIDKLKRSVNWEPRVSFRTGIEKILIYNSSFFEVYKKEK